MFETGLAAWRLSHMLVEEDGPGRIFARLRARTGIEYDMNGAVISYPDYNPLHCVYCTALYTSLAMLLVPRMVRRMLAVAGVAALIEAALVELPQSAEQP